MRRWNFRQGIFFHRSIVCPNVSSVPKFQKKNCLEILEKQKLKFEKYVRKAQNRTQVQSFERKLRAEVCHPTGYFSHRSIVWLNESSVPTFQKKSLRNCRETEAQIWEVCRKGAKSNTSAKLWPKPWCGSVPFRQGIFLTVALSGSTTVPYRNFKKNRLEILEKRKLKFEKYVGKAQNRTQVQSFDRKLLAELNLPTGYLSHRSIVWLNDSSVPKFQKKSLRDSRETEAQTWEVCRKGAKSNTSAKLWPKSWCGSVPSDRVFFSQ